MGVGRLVKANEQSISTTTLNPQESLNQARFGPKSATAIAASLQGSVGVQPSKIPCQLGAVHALLYSFWLRPYDSKVLFPAVVYQLIDCSSHTNRSPSTCVKTMNRYTTTRFLPLTKTCRRGTSMCSWAGEMAQRGAGRYRHVR